MEVFHFVSVVVGIGSSIRCFWAMRWFLVGSTKEVFPFFFLAIAFVPMTMGTIPRTKKGWERKGRLLFQEFPSFFHGLFVAFLPFLELVQLFVNFVPNVVPFEPGTKPRRRVAVVVLGIFVRRHDCKERQIVPE